MAGRTSHKINQVNRLNGLIWEKTLNQSFDKTVAQKEMSQATDIKDFYNSIIDMRCCRLGSSINETMTIPGHDEDLSYFNIVP